MLEHAFIATAEKRPSEYLPFHKWDREGGQKKRERYSPPEDFVSTLIKQCDTCCWVTHSDERRGTTFNFACHWWGAFLGFHILDKRRPSDYNRCHLPAWYIFMTVMDKHALPWERSRASAALSFPKPTTFRINIYPCLILSPLLLQPTWMNVI